MAAGQAWKHTERLRPVHTGDMIAELALADTKTREWKEIRAEAIKRIWPAVSQRASVSLARLGCGLFHEQPTDYTSGYPASSGGTFLLI